MLALYKENTELLMLAGICFEILRRQKKDLLTIDKNDRF